MNAPRGVKGDVGYRCGIVGCSNKAGDHEAWLRAGVVTESRKDKGDMRDMLEI